MKLHGTRATLDDAIPLSTSNADIRFETGKIKFSYVPETVGPISVSAYVLLVLILAVTSNFTLLGLLIYVAVYAVCIVVLSRPIEFNLKDETAYFDISKRMLGFKKRRNGKTYFLAFRYKEGERESIESLAGSIEKKPLKRRGNYYWPLIALLVTVVLAVILHILGLNPVA